MCTIELCGMARETCEKSGTSETGESSMSEVRGFWNFELHVALFPPVSPVSLESGIRDCSRSVHE
jgi:hypothetical protein